MEESPISKNDNQIESIIPVHLEVIDEESNSLNKEIISQADLSDNKNEKDLSIRQIYS